MPKVWRGVVRYALCISTWAASSVADVPVFNNLQEFNELVTASKGFANQTFKSSPIVAPIFQVNLLDEDGVDDADYIFLGTVYGQKAGPMILDAKDLSLIYADQQYANTYTSQVEYIDGKRYLAFWKGAHSRGHANGRCLFFDETYNLAYNVTAHGIDDTLADMHELKVTENKTVIFTTYRNIPYDCSPVGGPQDAYLMDSGFQEVDIETSEVIFQWAASDHFNITDSYAPYNENYGVDPSRNSGFDFAHINSVDKTPEGNYLVSSRHLSLLALIDGHNGTPIWILGGKRNGFHDLSDGNATNFSWQHDARFNSDQSRITMFDNHGETSTFCTTDCRSRGLELSIDATNKTVRVVHEYYHPAKINSGAMGGLQPLANGNVLVGWGYNPSFVEYRPDGTPVMDVQRGRIGEESLSDMFAYRVHKHDWTGRPGWPPSVAIGAPSGSTFDAMVYLSWNGATDVAKWAVFAADTLEDLGRHENLIAISDRSGFETSIFLGTSYSLRYIVAAAVTREEEVLGWTSAIDMTTGQPAPLPNPITSESISPPTPLPDPLPQIPSNPPEQPALEHPGLSKLYTAWNPSGPLKPDEPDQLVNALALPGLVVSGSSNLPLYVIWLVFTMAIVAVVVYVVRRSRKGADRERALYERVAVEDVEMLRKAE